MSTIETVENVNVNVNVNIEALEARKLATSKAAKEARDEFIAALRPASEEELKEVLDAYRHEKALPSGLNVFFKLTPTMLVLKLAKQAERRTELKDAKVRARYEDIAKKMAMVSAVYRETMRKGKDGKVIKGSKPKRTLGLRYVS